MFSNCWRRTAQIFTLMAAAFLVQSVGAQQAPPQCTLTASPTVVAAGATSTLTATCSPAATSFEWAGGTCTGTTSASCTVTPSVTTTYSVIGIGAGGASTLATTAVFATAPYEGIYQWKTGYYLSVHQIGGSFLIGTIYWVYTANPLQVGTRTVSDSDTFDLFAGPMQGSRATMGGTRFFRGCTLSYDFTFNSDSTLTVHLNSARNTPGTKTTDVDCTARYNSEVSDWTIPKIY